MSISIILSKIFFLKSYLNKINVFLNFETKMAQSKTNSKFQEEINKLSPQKKVNIISLNDRMVSMRSIDLFY